MAKTASKIRFKAKLRRPAESAKTGSWSFLVLPKNASARLPSRGITAIEGTLNGFPFQATLEPDGQKSHWLKVDRKLSEAAGAGAGDVVTLNITPGGRGTGARSAVRFERSSCGRGPEGASVVVGHHVHCAQRLDPLDHLRQAARNARTPDQKCLLDASCRQATHLLLRPVWIL